jgi:hypothetical protein
MLSQSSSFFDTTLTPPLTTALFAYHLCTLQLPPGPALCDTKTIFKGVSARDRPYQYATLLENQMRVVDLLPGTFEADIRIIITHTKFPSTPSFIRMRCTDIRRMAKKVPDFNVVECLKLRWRKHSVWSDTIFAVLGISPPKFAAKIKPNYSQPLADLFKDVFLAHISQVWRWELFGVELKYRRCSGPSWVPDLSTNKAGAWWGLTQQFSTGYSRLCFTLLDPGLLEVTGQYCATVVKATDALYPNLSDNEDIRCRNIELIRSWEPANMETASYVTGESLSDVYALTLLQNYLPSRYHDITSVYMNLHEWKACGGFGLFGPSARFNPAAACRPFDTNVSMGCIAEIACRGRAFMVTREGYIGLGPDGVQPSPSLARSPSLELATMDHY